MDTRTVFADKLVLPRALKVLDRGVLVGEPPNLWLMRDTDGDFKADTKELVNGTYGRGEAGIEHNANSLYWALDNVIYTSEHDWHLRLRNGRVRDHPDAQPRAVGRDAGRRGTHLPQRQRRAALRGLRRRRATTPGTPTSCGRAACTTR